MFRIALVATCLAGASAAAQDLAFRKHTLNREAQFTAAAAFDVNKDGKIDVVAGDAWYEGPAFTKKHFVRDVEIIQGRPDGFAHLTLDVNGDGWTDVITVNWRSRSIKWIEHPGEKLGPWKTHVIAEPGNMETGRLVDMEGTGKLAILPNGAQFAAWWSLNKKPDGSPDWQRHELPRELAGHGLGFGDVNGDGRGDVIGRFGWAEAPEDRRKGRWIWHADFDLDAASIPVLVVDVNGDGMNDLVYSRAHHFGIYWMEQTRDAAGKRGWVKHTIDMSWAGGHAPLWADMDGDGTPELVLGKRYLAHEGRDPGEYAPLCVYRYQFDKKTKTWKRGTISFNDHVGGGLDPKAVDLNGDGKLDLLCADRDGLYWLENLGPKAVEAVTVPTYSDRTNLLVVKDADGKERPVKTPFDWGVRRGHVMAELEKAVGPVLESSRRVPLDAKFTSIPTADKGDLKSVTFSPAVGERVTAYLHLPAGRTGKRPAVICPLDGPPGETPPFGIELPARGYVVLVVKRSSADTTATFCRNILRGFDLLDTLPEVDGNRIGIVAHGAGAGTLAAAFDQRFAATVTSCGFGPLAEAKVEIGDAVAALAPRPTYLVAPAKDPYDVEKAKAAVACARKVYAFRNADRSLVAVHPESGREFPEAERKKAYEWLDRILRP